MSTLTTRIAGYKFVQRTVTPKEIATVQRACEDYGRTVSEDYSGAAVGYFVDDNDVPQSLELPYELRSSRMTVNNSGRLLEWAASDVETLEENVAWHNASCECWRGGETCDKCTIDSAIAARLHMRFRGNGWQFRYDRMMKRR